MRDPKILEDTLSLSRSLFSKVVDGATDSPDEYPLGRLERELLGALMSIGAFLVARLCGVHTGYHGTSIAGHADVGTGKHQLKFKGRKKRWITTLFGRIFYWRAYYRNSTNDDSRWPRDEELGLAPDESLSPELQQKVALLSAVTESYDRATQTLKEFLPVDLQYKQAQRECLKLGAEMEEAQKEKWPLSSSGSS